MFVFGYSLNMGISTPSYYILCLFLDIPLIWACQYLHIHTMFIFGYSLNMGVSGPSYGHLLYTMFVFGYSLNMGISAIHCILCLFLDIPLIWVYQALHMVLI